MNGFSDPEHIAISKSRGIEIDWKDGHVSKYGLQYLRDMCPCATCTGIHGTPPRGSEPASPFPMFKPALKMAAAEPVGSYALRISWSDGHNSGIYSWEHLRNICPCPQCQGLRERSGTQG